MYMFRVNILWRQQDHSHNIAFVVVSIANLLHSMYFQLLLLVTLHYGCVVTGRNVVRRCIVLLVFPAIIGYASSGDDLLPGERAP